MLQYIEEIIIKMLTYCIFKNVSRMRFLSRENRVI